MPQILITQTEVNNHNQLPAMLNDDQQMTCNGIACVYANISGTDWQSIESSLDGDAVEITVLPKYVVEG